MPAYLATGMPPHFVLANNKFSSTFGTVLSTYRYNKRKMTDYWVALPGALFALIGSALGSRTVLLLDPSFLNYLLLVLIPVITLFTLFNKNRGGVKKELNISKWTLLTIASIIGLVIGFYDGFFGPGTGSLLMFCYIAILGYDFIGANANAKIVNLASNVAAMITFLISGKVVFAIAIPAAAFGIAGNWLGSKIVIQNGAKVIRPFFLLVLLLLFAKIAYNLIVG